MLVRARRHSTKAEGKAKGSDLHKAVVAGDTVGDPFKDASGLALNTPIKLKSVISLVFAPVFKVRAALQRVVQLVGRLPVAS